MSRNREKLPYIIMVVNWTFNTTYKHVLICPMEPMSCKDSVHGRSSILFVWKSLESNDNVDNNNNNILLQPDG